MQRFRPGLAALVAVLLVLLSAAPAAAQSPASDWSDALNINVTGTSPFDAAGNSNDDTASFVDGSGNTVVIYRQSSGDNSVRGHAYNVRVDGVWSEPQLLSTNPGPSFPAQAVSSGLLPNGNILAIYSFFDNNVTYQNIPYFRVWNHQSQSWSPQQLISGGIGGSQTARIVTTAGGATVLYNGTGKKLLMRRFSEANGFAAQVEFTTFDSYDSRHIRAVVLADGSTLVITSDDISGGYRTLAGTIAPDDTLSEVTELNAKSSTLRATPLALLNGTQGGAVAVTLADATLPLEDQYYLHYFDEAAGTWSTPHVVVGDYYYSSTAYPHLLVDGENRVHFFAELRNATGLGYGHVISAPNPSSAADWPAEPYRWLAPQDGSLVVEVSYASSATLGDRGVLAYSETVDPNGNQAPKRMMLLPIPQSGDPVDPIIISEILSNFTIGPTTLGLALDNEGRPSVNWSYKLDVNGSQPVAGSSFFDAVVPSLLDNEEEEVALPDPVCEQPLNIAITPASLTLAAGQTADVTVTVTNPCGDLTADHSDVLLSLPPGLTAVSAPEWVLNLIQRVAWQNISLRPGEQKSFTVTVAAAENVTTGPLTVEVYWRGRVANSVIGELLVGAPVAAVETAPPAPAAEAAAPAEPAPLPITLPNTTGEADYSALWLLLAAAGVTLVGTGVSRLR